MGSSQSIEQTYIINNNLTFVRDETNDVRFGAFKLYKNSDSNQFFQIQTKLYFNKEEAKKMKEQCTNRKKLNSDFILKLVDFKSAKEKEYCSSYKKTIFVYEYLELTLLDVYKQRLAQKKPNNQRYIFQDREIWYILRSILNALAYLKFNNSRLQVSPFMQNIMLDNYGRVKINDGFLGNVAQQLYQYLLVNKNQLNFQSSNPFKQYIDYYFPSPQILSNLKNQNTSPIHQPSKNEVFSLAMTILQLTTGDNISDCYDYQLLTINFNKIQLYQKRFQKIYSSELSQFVDQMLIEDEIERLDIDDLMDIIENYENASQIQIGAINQLLTTEDENHTTEMITDVIIEEAEDEEGKKQTENQTENAVDKDEKSKQQKHKEKKKQKRGGERGDKGANKKFDDYYFYELKDYSEPVQNGPQEMGLLPQFEIYLPNQSLNQSFQIVQEIQEKSKRIKIDNPQLLYQIKQQQALNNSLQQQKLQSTQDIQQKLYQQQEQQVQNQIQINDIPATNVQQNLAANGDLQQQHLQQSASPQQQHHKEQSKRAKKIQNVNKNLQQFVEMENSNQKNNKQEQLEQTNNQDEIKKQQDIAISQQEEYQNQLIVQQKIFEIQQQQEIQNFQNSQLYLQHQEAMKSNAQQQNNQQQQLRQLQTAEYNEEELEENLKINRSSQKANQLYVENYHSNASMQLNQNNQNDYQYTHNAVNTSYKKQSIHSSQQQQLQQDFNNYFNDRSFQSYLNYQQQQIQDQHLFSQQDPQNKQSIYQQLWPYQYIQDANFPTERPSNIKQKQQIFT